ncbi:hypothetical protein FOZ63_010158 [Perkinsus olseni]|uniref:Uncharacterized protein n=1 Tax=Perkinsus olseni TaxID=32597 RepID=A0A7J6UHI7_PEROL|nr:hypothetical protein FOZ63_010158 [Perkinsus olseni]
MLYPLQGCSGNGGGGTTSPPPTTGPPPSTMPPTTAFPTSPPGTLFPTGLYSFTGDLVPGVPANISTDFPRETDKINYVNVTVAAIHVYIENIEYYINATNKGIKVRISDVPVEYRSIIKQVTFTYFHANESIGMFIPLLQQQRPVYLTKQTTPTSTTMAI